MKKLFIILSLLFVSLGLSVSAQTNVSLPDVTANVGATINVPVTAPNLGAVGSMTLGMTYDTDVLEFIDFANNPFAGDPNFLTTVQNGKISVVWFSTTPKNIDSKLFDLQFKYLGGTSTLEFTGTQEITDENAQPLNVTFINGSVGPIPAPPSELTLSDHIATPGETFKMALTATSLANVGSMTLFVDYDAAKLNYVGVENNDFGFTSSESNGTITLAWFSTTPYSASADTLVNLVFEFVGPTGTTVSINPNSEITDASSNPITTITLNSGAVSLPNVGFTLPTIEALPDTKVSLPLMGKLLSSVGSFTIKISYDSGELVFDDYSNLISGSLTAQENNGVLTLAYFNTSGLTVSSDTIVNLNFTYKGSAGTSTAVTFVPAESEVTDLDSNPLLVDFTDGSIVELDVPPIPVVSIMQIQKTIDELEGPSPYDSVIVTTSGIVTATRSNGFFLQDSAAAWNGIWVFNNTVKPAVGDLVEVTALVIEYFGLTELMNVEASSIVSSGNALPSALSVTTAEVNDEKYESVLLTVQNAVVTDASIGNGEWTIDDGSGQTVVDDYLYKHTPDSLDVLNLTGIGYYSFGAYKLLPRNIGDIEEVIINPNPTELQAWWQLGAGEADFFANDNNSRGAAYNTSTGNVLVASRTGAPAIHILDSKTGSKVGELDMTGVAGGIFAINIVSVADDGAIYTANLALANGEFKLYKWDNESAAPVNIFAGVVAQRTGDAMRVVGSGTGTIVYASGSGSNKIYQFTTVDGASFTLNKEITVTAGIARGGIAPVSDAVDSDIWVNGTGTNAALISTDGTVLYSADGAVMASSFMNIDYMEIMNDMNEVVELIAVAGGNVEANSPRLEIWNVTDLNNVYLHSFGTLTGAWATNANGTGVAELVKFEDNSYQALHLLTNNGIALYSTFDVPAPEPNTLLTYWSANVANDNLPDYFTSAGANYERGMAYGFVDGKHRVYVVSRTNGAHIVIHDADNGAIMGNISAPQPSVGLFPLNVIDVSDDGVIFAANMTLDASSAPFTVYRWDSETAEPTIVAQYSGVGRMGDMFSVQGSTADNSIKILAGIKDVDEKIVVFNTTDNGNSFTAQELNLAGLSQGTNPNFQIAADGTIWAKSYGKYLTHYNADGSLIDSVSGSVVATSASKIKYASLDDAGTQKDFIFAYYPDVSGSGTGEFVSIVDVTNSASSAVVVSLTPSLGNIANGNGTGSVDLRAYDDSTLVVYVMGTNNGIGAYSSSKLTPTTPLYPPQNLSAQTAGTGVQLDWNLSGGPGSLVTLNSGAAISGFYHDRTKAYGSVFDLSGLESPELMQIDFAHSAFEFFDGPAEYVVHIYDWDTQTELYTDTLGTVVDINLNEQWETIKVTGVADVAKLGVFIQSITPDSFGDGWPTVLTDDTAPPKSGGQVIINNLEDPFNNLQEPGNAALGHFLIDLWVKTASGTAPMRVQPVAVNSNSQTTDKVKARTEITNFTGNPRRAHTDFLMAFVKGYNVYRGTALDNLTLIGETGKDQMTYVDADLPDGTYFFGVTAVYGEQESNMEVIEFVHTAVGVEKDLLPTEFSLEQNFPNPFNPTTVIKFGLKVDSKVSLKIYNILGQEIATLINGTMNAGFQRVEFKASYLSSGVYLYRIEANGLDGSNFIDVKKMMLLK